MANLLKIEINEHASDEDVELCALSADRTSDQNLQRKASEAKVELKRRDRAYEREEWQMRFDAESQERVKSQRWQEAQRQAAQEFQERLANKQEQAQEQLASKQLQIARTQATTAKFGTAFAALSAFAAIALVYLTAMQATSVP